MQIHTFNGHIYFEICDITLLFLIIFAVSVAPIISPVHTNVGTNASLDCEMTRYIRPDSKYLWRRFNEVIKSGGRFQISYNSLTDGRARNGGVNLTFSRLSTLVIASVDGCDAGIYTCFVSGTNAAADVELVVEYTVPVGDSCLDGGMLCDYCSIVYKMCEKVQKWSFHSCCFNHVSWVSPFDL